MTSKVLNINVGLLGHVDSGKTSIAKCLSTTSSTACFDKSPQSQERGITIDLGFSSFTISDVPEKFQDGQVLWEKLQFTLVDCPGHASLIRTIIGGVQIIDMILLVVDITKGIQTQTAECLIIGEVMKKPMIVVLNKVDLVDASKRAATIEKVTKKMKLTLANTIFLNAPITHVSAHPGASGNEPPIGIDSLIKILIDVAATPVRHADKPTVFAVDHCFGIKGKGTVMTGTMLQGKIQIGDDLEIPQLGLIKKVKSIQMFKQNVDQVMQGDRAGVCVTQFDPKLLERGIACSSGTVTAVYAAIVQINPIKYYKHPITNKIKYHVSVGHETVLGKLTMFTLDHDEQFSIDKDYEYRESIEVEDFAKARVFALIEFDSPVMAWENSLLIGSRLDVDVHSSSCRIAFHSCLLHSIRDKNYQSTFLPKLKIYKCKQKTGVVQRMVNENEVIVQSIFKKETNMNLFVFLKVSLSTGEDGIIESTFGTSGKVKVKIPSGLKSTTAELLVKKKGKAENEHEASKSNVLVTLNFKKCIFDKDKPIFQT